MLLAEFHYPPIWLLWETTRCYIAFGKLHDVKWLFPNVSKSDIIISITNRPMNIQSYAFTPWCRHSDWYTVQYVSESTWLYTCQMLSILSDVAFLQTKGSHPAIAPIGIVFMWPVQIKYKDESINGIRMNSSTESALPSWSLCIIGTTTMYFWG